MDELRASEESAFVAEDVEQLVRDICDTTLRDQLWDNDQCPHWSHTITCDVLAKLAAMSKPFKYAGTCCGQPVPLMFSCITALPGVISYLQCMLL